MIDNMRETVTEKCFVVLNSGGPLMYVEKIEPEGDVEIATCSWKLNDGTEQREAFPVECVVVHIAAKI